MATRAATAARDRESRERIADKDRRERAREHQQDVEVNRYRATTDRVTQSASAAGQMARGAGSLISKGNDPTWYKKFDIDKYGFSLPTFSRLGKELFPNWRGSTNATSVVPGICVFHFLWTLTNQSETNVIGATHYKNSPINLSLTRFMAELRKRNSRIGDYDAFDWGLYWYASASIIDQLGNLAKAIQAYNTYYCDNAYFAKTFISACGFNSADFIEHIADYKLLLARYLKLFNSTISIPKSLSFLERSIWLSTIVIKDHAYDNAQVYMFKSTGWYYIDETENYLHYTSDSLNITFNVMQNRLATQFEHIMNSQGIVTMMADLRAAYDSSDFIQFDVNMESDLSFSTSIHDLEQVHNLKTLPAWMSQNTIGYAQPSNPDIAVDTDGYLYQGNMSSGSLDPFGFTVNASGADFHACSCSAAQDNQYLDFYDDKNATADMILEATRCRQTYFSVEPTGGNHHIIENCGTEVFFWYELYVQDANSNTYTREFGSTDLLVAPDAATLPFAMIKVQQASTFDWMPIIRVCLTADLGVNVVAYIDFGEIDKPVLLPKKNLYWLHEACAFSEFYVTPGKGKYYSK